MSVVKVHKSALFWRKTRKLTLAGFNWLRRSSTIRPARENALSHGILVPGIGSRLSAILERSGNLEVLPFLDWNQKNFKSWPYHLARVWMLAWFSPQRLRQGLTYSTWWITRRYIYWQHWYFVSNLSPDWAIISSHQPLVPYRPTPTWEIIYNQPQQLNNF